MSAVTRHLGQPLPGEMPQVFARGTLSTAHLEHSAPAFAPDGREVFWSIWRRPQVVGEQQVIMTMRCVDGVWTQPAVASFSGRYLDGGPVFSADGKRLYFYSLRPRPEAGREGVSDIWFVEKKADLWGEPVCLGLVARYPELREISQPSVARNGTLYFIAHLPGPMNDSGIYRAAPAGGTYLTPEAMPQCINLAPYLNWTPHVAPDESFLLFSSNRGAPKQDYGDIYLSRRKPDGTWSDPVNLGAPINSRRQERFPALAPDGRVFFFTRPTPGQEQDVYWVETSAIPALRIGTRADSQD